MIAVGVFGLLSVVFSTTTLTAQTHEVTVDGETFRKTADGRRLADLGLGLQVELVRSAGAWVEVSFAGWVPTSALAATNREGHDRIITRVGGQNLHAAPSGGVSGRLLQGLLLDHVSDRDSWTQVSRSGWVRMSSLRPISATDRSFARPTTTPDVERPPALVSSGRRLLIGEEAIDVLGSPDGDTVAVVRSGTPITVVERGNSWTRVRVEGWVRSDRLVTTDLDSALAEVSAASLRASPDDYVGLRLRWTVQFVALERAEPERTDFYEGEPFILARAPDPADGFVYMTVPPDLLAAVEGLTPLDMIDVLALVRTGRSALMGVPVLDLLALF
ncbi:MAG: hypothetical protein ACC682_00560 [Gemmatimonadota bacterium]